MRVLLIDDSSTERRALRRLLGGLGVLEVCDAANGSEALVRMESEDPFDLALVDWAMPVMDGVEFVRAVREQPRWGDLRLVLCASAAGASEVAPALADGADDFLGKPCQEAELAAKLLGLGLLPARGDPAVPAQRRAQR